MKIRKTKYWVVVNSRGYPVVDSMDSYKEGAIYTTARSYGETWECLKSQGFRVAKVTIQEVTK